MNSQEEKRIVHVGAVVLHEQRILFVRQTESHSLGPVWTIPWGVLDQKESPSEAALRETVEEAGVSAQVLGLVAAQLLPPPWQGTLALVFLCQHLSGSPKPDGIETSAARYLSTDELSDSIGEFEPWSLWLARQVLAGHTSVLSSLEGNPFGSEGFIAKPPRT
jgi:ADP-ribose pyrophosphatase YjhB (NUDIX family)